jgi:hypothetical protein
MLDVKTLAKALGSVLLLTAAAADEPRATAPPSDVLNEYRLTMFPSYRISDSWSGFGYLGWVYKPDADYDAYYLGTGAYHMPTSGVQLWAGLISVYTDKAVDSDLLELRPFLGVKLVGSSETRKWRYYNWTRYELRLTETRDTEDWTTVHRVRNQTRLEIPLASPQRAWTPKSWYLLADVEPIYRSDTGEIDPLRVRVGLGHVALPRLLVELQYYAQYTRSEGEGLRHTDNIFRLNFKLLTKHGLLSRLGDDVDD